MAFQLEVENVGGGMLEVNVTGPDWVDIIPHQMKLGPLQKMVADVAVDRYRGVAVPGETSAITLVSNTGDDPVTITVSIPASSSLRQPGNVQLSKCAFPPTQTRPSLVCTLTHARLEVRLIREGHCAVSRGS